MLKNSSQNIFKYLLLPALLMLFVASSNLALMHSFSHQSVEQVHKNTGAPVKDVAHCAVCFLAGSNHHILLSAVVTVAIAAFYVAFPARKFNKVKLSYLLSSYLSRAPPQHS